MAKKTINQEFDILREAVIHPQADELQVLEMKRAFYAGASVSLAIICESMLESAASPNQDPMELINNVANLQKELQTFAVEQGAENSDFVEVNKFTVVVDDAVDAVGRKLDS